MNQSLFSPLNLSLWALMALVTLAGFLLLPPGIALPVHWGPSGQPDAFWSRDAALLMVPVVIGVTSLLFWGIGRFAPPEQVEASRFAWRTVIPSVSALFLVIQSSIILIGLGYPDMTVRIICGSMGVMLVLMGNIMPKTQPNGLAGIRLPWLRDPTVWRSTQRLGGILFIAGGLILFAAALLLSDPIQLLVAIGIALVIPLVGTTVYSYRLAHRAD